MPVNNACNQSNQGLQANTASGTFFGRSLTAGSTKIVVTNPDGTAGNPTIDVSPGNIAINTLGSTPLNTTNGGTGVATPTAHTIPIAEGASAMNFLGPLTNGQLLIGSTGADPTPATLSAGSGISVTNAAGSITISANFEGLTWNSVTTTSATMVAGNGYLANNAALVTLTLPTTAAQFTSIVVDGVGAGGWKIAQNAGQTINFSSTPTTAGTGGSLASINQFDSVQLLCVVANTTWNVIGSVGNITVT